MLGNGLFTVIKWVQTSENLILKRTFTEKSQDICITDACLESQYLRLSPPGTAGIKPVVSTGRT